LLLQRGVMQLRHYRVGQLPSIHITVNNSLALCNYGVDRRGSASLFICNTASQCAADDRFGINSDRIITANSGSAATQSSHPLDVCLCWTSLEFVFCSAAIAIRISGSA